MNGTVEYSTTGKGPVSFMLGAPGTPSGVQEGIRLMQRGEKAILYVPSHLAFRSSLQLLPRGIREALIEDDLLDPHVLPFSILIYEIELLNIE
ncbi:MAG: FKBP-type peptidyl-prolyl cis-trans isomerase [Bacteroidia bacterium]|nr:FKBP-type peptidyl-prolyl cis-trans isomerase [Bacteroidia bacterium]